MTVSGARPSRAAFRHDPPELGAGLVVRGRLVAALRGRFERRLTVVAAGAGFGKTTLLAQAVAENHMEQAGTDVWLRVTPADRDPGHLLAGLTRSLLSADSGRSTTVDDLVEEVWSRAPTSVAFVIDDAHVLGDADGAWAVVRELLDLLPANGHLVVAGRTEPPLPTSRLLAADEAVVIDEAALAFTPDELGAFGTARGVDPALAEKLPPWPALAVLQSAAGSTASAAFVGDEVLAALPDEQVRLLALAAGLDALDDVLVEALAPGSGWTAADVVRGVPLVQADGQGAYRLHGLLAAVLDGRVDAAERSAALAAAGVRLLAAGADRRAIEAAALAGDRATLHRAICRFLTRPIRRISVPDVVALADRLPPDLRAAPIGAFLDAARQWEGDNARAEQLFVEAEARARAEGDDEVEALCTWRIVQLRYLDDHDRLVVEARHDELAARGVPLARSTPAFVRSVLAQRRGDITAALAALDDLDDADPEQRRETMTVRLVDLGRPEAVPAAIEDLFSPGSVDLFAAQAIWLRGEIPPDLAWAVAGSLPGVAGRAGVQHEQVSIRGLVALAALAVGRTDDAEALLDRARAVTDLVGAHVRLLVTVGDALVALQREDEDAARDGLRRALEEVPLGLWPARPYLYALA
ncbi:MAG TPA: AAA family ATPase, partial [Iamia sp.]